MGNRHDCRNLGHLRAEALPPRRFGTPASMPGQRPEPAPRSATARPARINHSSFWDRNQRSSPPHYPRMYAPCLAASGSLPGKWALYVVPAFLPYLFCAVVPAQARWPKPPTTAAASQLAGSSAPWIIAEPPTYPPHSGPG